MNQWSTPKACHECGAMFCGYTRQIRCNGCRYAYEVIRARAIKRVQLAVRAGHLTNLRRTHVACVDCGTRAEHYDHRDYNKPLAVDPVCRACNFRRGPAAPLRTAA